MKDKKFLALSILFFLLFFVMIAIASVDQQSKGFFTKAKNSNLSPLKSFVIVFPQVGVVNSTKVKVTVYLRDTNGSSMANRSVKLASSQEGVNISPGDTQNTNDLGMAQFNITSSSPGQVQLTATDLNSNTPVANIPTVQFTQ